MVVSEAVKWALRLAKIEAKTALNDVITRDHIFIGICSLEKMYSGIYVDFRKFHGMEEYPHISTYEEVMIENDELKRLFQFYGMEIATLRHKMRKSMKSHHYSPPSHPFDSGEKNMDWQCNFYSEKAHAISIMDGYNHCNSMNLLMYLLEKPTETINHILGNYSLHTVIAEIRYRLDQKIAADENLKQNNNFFNSIETPYLNEIGTNLTQLAAQGTLEPIIGREDEILNLMRTLSRKKKNNPLLVGEAGVGKTALVKALAQKIVDGKVPQALLNKRIYEINMTSLVSGTKYRGEFEQKMQFLLNEAKNSQIIVFIDEFHTAVGAGLSEGTSMDVSNMIKPALQEGNLTCIGATTLAEYRRYVKKDSALDRRFQTIQVNESTHSDTELILNGLRKSYEDFYNVKIEDSAISSAIDLSIQYLPQKRLPDKALDLIEDACSSKIIQQNDFYACHYQVMEITAADIVEVLENRTSIPIKLGRDERKEILELDQKLKKQVIGQNAAIDALCKRIKIARAGLNNPNQPFGVFLFLGPTGVGKTLLGKSLAQTLFNQNSLIKVDMSEYMDPGSSFKLFGAPPGFVGKEEGILSGALQSNPYSVVILDEIEKAHYSIFDLFLQIFDEGKFTDGKGMEVDARSAIFIMTSNLTVSSSDYGISYGMPENKDEKVRESLLSNLRPEFVNRIDEVLIFNSLSSVEMKKITRNMLVDLALILEDKKIKLDVDKPAIDYLAQKGLDAQFGARPLQRTIDNLVKFPISEMIINGELLEGDKIMVKMKNKELVVKNQAPFYKNRCFQGGTNWADNMIR
jgi:ATP-dependent Clp protease ATP-binding subunit ClpC